MKATSAQMLMAASTILAGILANDKDHNYTREQKVGEALCLAQMLEEGIQDTEVIPSDEEIKTACDELVSDTKPVGAALLGQYISNRFAVQLNLAYIIIQKAVQLGYISPAPAGKSKTVYTRNPHA